LCSSIACSFFASSYSAFSAILAELAGHADAIRDFAAAIRAQELELLRPAFRSPRV
jgi:hypothetical protein